MLDTSQFPELTRTRLARLERRMAVMQHHPTFSRIRSIDGLRTFMEWHVFAVWDFMSLLKRLQRDLTSTAVPWIPPSNTRAARLINEIVLGEETDDAPGGAHASHFDLYRAAMLEVGASTAKVDAFLRALRRGASPEGALAEADVPGPVASFVRSTLHAACLGQTAEVLGSFFFGREDPIPTMFSELLARWSLGREQAPTFVYYLERHVQLDAEDHGPAVREIITETLGDDHAAWTALLDAAEAAVERRIELWDGLGVEIERIEAARAPAA